MCRGERWSKMGSRIIQEIHMLRKRFYGKFFMQTRCTPVPTGLDPDGVALTEKGMDDMESRTSTCRYEGIVDTTSCLMSYR